MGKDKIKFKEKLAYATVNFGNIPIMTIINGYLLIFYTNICGLSPAACATLFLSEHEIWTFPSDINCRNHSLQCKLPDVVVWTDDGSIRKTGDCLCFLHFTWSFVPGYGYFPEQSSSGYDRGYERKKLS